MTDKSLHTRVISAIVFQKAPWRYTAKRWAYNTRSPWFTGDTSRTEQKGVYRHRLDYVPDVAIPFIGKALNSKEFQQGAPLKVSVEETDEKYKSIVEENLPVYERLKKMRLKPAENVI